MILNPRSVRVVEHEQGHEDHRVKHGHARRGKRTPEFHSWRSMLGRCCEPNHHSYSRYGGQGVTVCMEWSGSDGFVTFLADMGERPPCTTLHRIDPEQGYSKGNCRWATRAEQRRNQRNTKLTVPKARAIRALRGRMSQGEIAAAFEDCDPVSAGFECLRGDKAGNAGANDANVVTVP